MSSQDDKANQINNEYKTISDKPEDDFKENKDISTSNVIIGNMNDYEVDNEKPYYEQKDQIELKKSEHNSNIFFRIKNHIENIINNYYNETFFYSLLLLLIQVIIIFILTLLGFIFEINEIFVENPLVNIISTTIVIIIMYFSALFIIGNDRYINLLYIHMVLYVPCMVCYCFALSGFTEKINIIFGLVLYNLDILSFIIAVLIIEVGLKMYILFSIISGLISIIVLIIFHFKYINDSLTTLIISTVGLSEIIYLILAAIVIIKVIEHYD